MKSGNFMGSRMKKTGVSLPASVVVRGRCCSRWWLNCSSHCDVLRTVTVVVRRKCRLITPEHKRLYFVLSSASIRMEHHKSAMSIVMKMNDSLGMSTEADVDIFLLFWEKLTIW